MFCGSGCKQAFDVINEDNVYTCTGQPLRSDIKCIVDWMLNENFTTAYDNINKMKNFKGLALQDMLTEVHSYVHRIEFPPHIKITLLQKMAEVEYRLASGTSEKIQLSSLIAAFQSVRDHVVAEAE